MVSNHPSSAQMMGMLVSRHEWFKLGSKLSGLSWGVSWEKVGWKLGRKLTTLLARSTMEFLVVVVVEEEMMLKMT